MLSAGACAHWGLKPEGRSGTNQPSTADAFLGAIRQKASKSRTAFASHLVARRPALTPKRPSFQHISGHVSARRANGAHRYNSTSYYDDMTWAASWMYQATGQATYLSDAITFYVQHSQVRVDIRRKSFCVPGAPDRSVHVERACSTSLLLVAMAACDINQPVCASAALSQLHSLSGQVVETKAPAKLT